MASQRFVNKILVANTIQEYYHPHVRANYTRIRLYVPNPKISISKNDTSMSSDCKWEIMLFEMLNSGNIVKILKLL